MQGPVDWRRLTLLFALAAFVEGVFASHVVAFLPLQLPKLGVAPADVAALTGPILAFSSLFGIIFLPFWSALADRFGRQVVIVRSFVVFLVSALIMALAASLVPFVVGRALMSLSQGNTGLILATMTDHVPAPRAGLAFGIANAAGPVGACLGPALGSLVFEVYGLAPLLGADAACLTVVAAMLLFGYREHFVAKRDASVRRMAYQSVRQLSNRRVVVLLFALTLLYSGWLGAYAYVPVILADLVGEQSAPSAVGLVLTSGGVAMMLFAPAIGALADRFGRLPVLWVATVVQCGLFLLPLFARSAVEFAIAWSVLTGVAGGIFSVSFVVLAEATPSENRNQVMIFSYLPVVAGTVLGPALAGVFARHHAAVALPLGIVTTLLALPVLRWWEVEARRPAPAVVGVATKSVG